MLSNRVQPKNKLKIGRHKTTILYSICVDCSRMQYPHSVQFIRSKHQKPYSFCYFFATRISPFWYYRVEFHCQEAQIVFSHFFFQSSSRFFLFLLSFWWLLLHDSLSFIMPINLSHSMYNSLNLIEIKRITQKKQSATWGGFKMIRIERERKKEETKKKEKKNVYQKERDLCLVAVCWNWFDWVSI